jgi:hypothetical protein
MQVQGRLQEPMHVHSEFQWVSGRFRSVEGSMVIGVHSGMSASGIQGVTWKKSRRSNPSGNCVEIAELPEGAIAVRDSRQQSGPALIYSRIEIGLLISRARAGGLDRPVGRECSGQSTSQPPG